MAIIGKDGKEYKLSQPNPALITQELWGEKPIVEGIIGQRYISKSTAREIKQEEPEDIQIVNRITEKQEQEMFIVKQDIIDVWVLPSLGLTETFDPLYQETHKRIKYGEKSLIKGKIYDSDALFLQLITKQPYEPFTILYPKSADSNHWKVVKSEKMDMEGFYLLTCELSDYQPSFG